jgi:drug/metabolite transporter (DMT)-like permease
MRSMRNGWYGVIQLLALVGAALVVWAFNALSEWIALAALFALVAVFATAYTWRQRRARDGRIRRTKPGS